MGRILRTNSLEDRGKMRIDISTRLRKVVFSIGVSMMVYTAIRMALRI